jgi:hypothetical protein
VPGADDIADDAEVLGRDGARQVAETRSVVVAQPLLCWLALLLIRIAENQANDTWRNLRDELERMHLGTFTGSAGTSQQRTELTPRQREILHALAVAQPPLFLHLQAPEPTRAQATRPNPLTGNHPWIHVEHLFANPKHLLTARFWCLSRHMSCGTRVIRLHRQPIVPWQRARRR